MQSHMRKLLLVGLSVLFSPLIYIVVMELSDEVATRHLGSVCCLLAICGYASPLATIVSHMLVVSLCYNPPWLLLVLPLDTGSAAVRLDCLNADHQPLDGFQLPTLVITA